MITTKERPQATRKAVDIFHEGQIIGVADPYRESEWHVQIKLPLPSRYPDYVLIQGICGNINDAVFEAIISSLKFHQEAIEATQAFGDAFLDHPPAKPGGAS